MIAGSSHFHFVLIPPLKAGSVSSALEDEIAINFQALCILFLFPMASIDIYVSDVIWYVRHHYNFFQILKVSFAQFIKAIILDWLCIFS